MSLQWLQPLAWFGLGLLIVPLLVHLLARHRSRRMPFPTLKFLPVTQMAALRRRVVRDWPLLVIRMLIVMAAVAAAAAPVFVSEARRDAWDRRVARAIVVTTPEHDGVRSAAREEAESSFTSAQFSALTLPDALRDAWDWLQQQPPAAREIVVIGDLREHAISANDLDRIPTYVGLRFLPMVVADNPATLQWRTVAESSVGRAAVFAATVIPEQSRTRVQYKIDNEATMPRIRVMAASDRQQYADALLRAVLREGLVLGTQTDRAITIGFAGAQLPATGQGVAPAQAWMRRTLERNPEVRGGEVGGELVVTTSVPVTDPRAPRIVADVLRAAFAESRGGFEPRRIPASILASWSRPSAGSPPHLAAADEGDRRWFWALALGLLAVEYILRRRPRVS